MSLAIVLVMMSMRFCEWITNMKISGGGDRLIKMESVIEKEVFQENERG